MITIIVMLILVGVSIQIVINSDLLNVAAKMKDNQRVAEIIDACSVWKNEKLIDTYSEEKNAQTIEEFIDTLKEQEKLKPEEAEQGKEKGYVKIGDKTIYFVDGIEDCKFTVKSSNDDIKFERTIKEGNIKQTKKDYNTYNIVGISKEEQGTYITSGSIEGISGTIEIIGDINDTTFQYTLTDFMHGDEIFYCKINIDGEEYIQKIIVEQGDCITYEEDFIGIEIWNPNNYVEWTIEENENYSGGKALIVFLKEGASASSYIQAKFYGRGIEILTMYDDNTGLMYIVTKGSKNTLMVCKLSNDSPGTVHYREELFGNGQRANFLDNNTLTTLAIRGAIKTTNEDSYVVFDAVKIYK